MTKVKKENAERTSLDNILFPVWEESNPDLCNSEYCRFIFGKPEGIEADRKFLNACSDRYELIPNSEIFPKIEEVLKANGIEYEANYSHINHVRFYCDIIITDSRFLYNVSGNDQIMPKLIVHHSYNGLTKYKIQFGYFRLICSNGLTIPLQEMKDFNLSIGGKHTISIQQSLNRLDQTLKYFAQNLELIQQRICQKYIKLIEQNVINLNERVEKILTANSIIAVDNKKFNTVQFITDIVEFESKKLNQPVNDWLIYNGINQYIFSDRNKVVPELRTEKDQKILEYMLVN